MTEGRAVAGGAEPVVRLADAVRRLVEATAASTPDESTASAALQQVEAALAALGPPPSAAEHRAEAEAGRRPPRDPFGSDENPLAPPLRTRPSPPGAFQADVVLSLAYAGPPGRAHGGVVTGILDHASGFAVASLGVTAVTVSLAIELEQPTPYGEPLVVTAVVDERDGRKNWVEASVRTAQGRVLARCRTLLIELREPPAWASGPHYKMF